MEKVILFVTITMFLTGMIIHSQSEIRVGDQIWSTQNLSVDKFRNGDPIIHVTTLEGWNKANDNKQPAWCYYNFDKEKGDKYGKLYNWYAVNDRRGLAPVGWRIPSHADWRILLDYLGHSNASKLKNSSGWAYNGSGTNDTGFSAIPGGFLNARGGFNGIGSNSSWWSSTEISGIDKVYVRSIWHNRDYVSNETTTKNIGSGYYVRCVKD